MITYEFNNWDAHVYPTLASTIGKYYDIYILEDKIVPDLWYVWLIGSVHMITGDFTSVMYYMDRDELEEFVAEKVLEQNWCLEGDIEWEMDGLKFKNNA